MKRLAQAWLMLAVAAASSMAAATQADEPLAVRIDRLVRLGYEQPDQALRQLERLRSEAKPASPRELSQILFGEAQIEAGRGSGAPRARELADRLRAQADSSGQAMLAAQADLVGAIVAETAYQIDTSGALAERALRVLESACKASGELPPDCDYRAVWLGLRIFERFQDYAGAHARADSLRADALNLVERARDSYRLAITLGAQALVLTQRKDEVAAYRLFDRAEHFAGNDLDTRARLRMLQAMAANYRGQPETGLRLEKDAVDLADQAGSKRLAAHQRLNLSYYLLKQNRPAESLQMAQQALPVVQAFQDQRMERTLRLNMALAYTALGQVKPALVEMAKGRALGEPGKAVNREALELRELGEAMAKVGQYQHALALYHEERALSAKARKVSQDSSMKELRIKYDSERKQAELDLLQRERQIQQEELSNQGLARQAWLAVLALTLLSVALAVVMVRRVREANRSLKASQALLRAQSERDPLTDLANRRHFMAVMESRAGSQFEGALLMVDIDHFKQVNDRHGHAAGDVVICEVARRINEVVRDHDLVVRWGGEEFLVFAPGVHAEQLELLAQRVLLSVSGKPVQLETGTLDISVSIGFAGFPLPPHQVAMHWERAVNLADMALYTAKNQGRNCAIGIRAVHVYKAERMQEIEADFEQARQNGQLELSRILGARRDGAGTTAPSAL
jgi:diguanylate cyclase (GGDEF)-like protein